MKDSVVYSRRDTYSAKIQWTNILVGSIPTPGSYRCKSLSNCDVINVFDSVYQMKNCDQYTVVLSN